MAAEELVCATCGGAIVPGDALTVEVGGVTVRVAALAGELERCVRERAARLRHHRCERDPRVLPAAPVPDLAMRWRFAQETIEDLADRSLHRVGCPELAGARDVVRHRSGSVAARTELPNECDSCRPAVEIELGGRAR